MGDVRTLFGQFMKIQMEQNKLLKEISEKSCSLSEVTYLYDAIKEHEHYQHGHIRGLPSINMERKRDGLSMELCRLKHRVEQNQERLEELYKQLFAEVF